MQFRVSRSVLILTAHDEAFRPIAELTIPRMQRYANRHGCDFRVVTDVDRSRPGGWIKIPPIRQALAEEFDFVFWIDADVLLIRDDVDIRSAARDGRDLHMSWMGPETMDWQAPSWLVGHFNTGVMLIRNTGWSRDFFDRVWASTPLDHPWWEQATILDLLGYKHLIDRGSADPANPDRPHVER